MNKKSIRIYMLHSAIKNEEDIYKYLKIDRQDALYELVWDNQNPEYLIATELIYTDLRLWDEFVKLYSKDCVCIYHAGECIAPDLNLFDYAIVFDKNLKCEDRIVKMPTRLFFAEMIFEKENNLIGKEKYIKGGIEDKKFCNYIYSNGLGHENRTKIFHLLNGYKEVDSWGKYLRNVEEQLKVTPQMGWEALSKECIDVKSHYKFSVAFENATYNGYTSEKIFSSLEAHTVPIYWGNPLIAEEINPEAFINCHDFDTLEDVLAEVKRIDNDDELWVKMVCSPWKTKEQNEKEEAELREYYRFVQNIFMQPAHKAKRRGEGFHPGRYREWFFQTQSNNNKFQHYHDVEIKWIENLRKGIYVETYFQKRGYKTVVIYGMAQLGLMLYDEIKLSNDISVLYAIDQGSPDVPNEIEVYKLNELAHKEEPDVIVIAVPYLVSQIKSELRKIYSCECVSILDVVKG